MSAMADFVPDLFDGLPEVSEDAILPPRARWGYNQWIAPSHSKVESRIEFRPRACKGHELLGDFKHRFWLLESPIQ